LKNYLMNNLSDREYDKLMQLREELRKENDYRVRIIRGDRARGKELAVPLGNEYFGEYKRSNKKSWLNRLMIRYYNVKSNKSQRGKYAFHSLDELLTQLSNNIVN